MKSITSGDAEIAYEVLGNGPPVVLLHPFPAHHGLWLPASQALVTRYRVILLDLRGHGESGIGEGPATMAKHAEDIARVCDAEGVGRAVFAGVSIGGYALFELWRRHRARVESLILCDTRAPADSAEGRTNRLRAAADVLERGTEPFLDGLIPRLLGRSTQNARPDLVSGARAMMMKMSPEDISLVQKGMAERPDSVPTLSTINVPTLVVVGGEDVLSPVADAEQMRSGIAGAQMQVVPRAGHFAIWEQPEAVGKALRQFVDVLHGA
ncbi:MAG TPA: alpha/beta fold hydrolase [Terriglobales bacterium]|jgi:pimeloyl-ACP methyl ester carboxylesterase